MHNTPFTIIKSGSPEEKDAQMKVTRSKQHIKAKPAKQREIRRLIRNLEGETNAKF